MDGSSPYISLLIFLILFVLNTIVYGFSAAVQNISDSDLELLKERDKKVYGKISRIIDAPYKFINTVQATTTLMTLIAGACELQVVFRFMHKWSIIEFGQFVNAKLLYVFIFLIVAYFFIFVILTIGILLPKRLGISHAYGFAKSLANIVYTIMIVFTPLTVVTCKVSNMLLLIFGIDINQPDENVTEEDIMSVINEGHEQGVLLASEAEMINNIVEFGDKEAKDIMVHRKSITAVNAELTLREVVEFILSENNSRFPAYVGDIDNVIGIITLRDVMVAMQTIDNQEKQVNDIIGLIRKATFIPETRKINVLFKTMQSEKIHMAIVIDEYGQTSGIIAMEDILEEIVGNILDEYDEEETDIVKIDDCNYIVKGMTTLDDLTDKLGIEYDGEEYDTINGFLTSRFERILSNDERPQITVDGITYKILNVQNKMISSVQVTIPGHEIDCISK